MAEEGGEDADLGVRGRLVRKLGGRNRVMGGGNREGTRGWGG